MTTHRLCIYVILTMYVLSGCGVFPHQIGKKECHSLGGLWMPTGKLRKRVEIEYLRYPMQGYIERTYMVPIMTCDLQAAPSTEDLKE